MAFLKPNDVLTSSVYYAGFLIMCLMEMVNAKECRYILDSGEIKYFYCNIYEYCCGTMCCRLPTITFYQMWYFWLMIFLTLIFCSGGGWWYRLRNQGPFITSAMSPRVSPPRTTMDSGPTRTYMLQPTSFPSAPYSAQYAPPPPYYGPPPSYDTVVTQMNQNQTVPVNQNQNVPVNQNQTVPVNQNQTIPVNQNQTRLVN